MIERREVDRAAQPAPDAVALGRVPDALRHREAEVQTFRGAAVADLVGGPPTPLRRDPVGMEAPAGRGREEIGAPPQPTHGDRAVGHGAGRTQAERRLRPWARRAAITLRPPAVAIRARKP